MDAAMKRELSAMVGGSEAPAGVPEVRRERPVTEARGGGLSRARDYSPELRGRVDAVLCQLRGVKSALRKTYRGLEVVAYGDGSQAEPARKVLEGSFSGLEKLVNELGYSLSDWFGMQRGEEEEVGGWMSPDSDLDCCVMCLMGGLSAVAVTGKVLAKDLAGMGSDAPHGVDAERWVKAYAAFSERGSKAFDVFASDVGKLGATKSLTPLTGQL